jgi:hypothetical protein
MDMVDIYYRYIDELVGDEYSSSPRIRLLEFHVRKRTPKGVWLHISKAKLRFVLNEGRKRYAFPDKEGALASFIARKRIQKNIYAARHDTAEQMLQEAAAMMEAKDWDRSARWHLQFTQEAA